MTTPKRNRILDNIERCDDPAKLRRFMKNARQRGAPEVYDAAFQRLISVRPTAQVGTIAHDVWRTIYAFEEVLTEERGRTVLLARTRQKIRRVGEIKTVIDLTLKTNPSDGFLMLKKRGILELSFEALVVSRTEDFPSHVVEAAHTRLKMHDFDTDRASEYWSRAGDYITWNRNEIP